MANVMPLIETPDGLFEGNKPTFIAGILPELSDRVPREFVGLHRTEDFLKKLAEPWFCSLPDLGTHHVKRLDYDVILPGFYSTGEKRTSKNAGLGGGFEYFLDFHPEVWGNDPIWRAYFSNGLVQAPTRGTILEPGELLLCFAQMQFFFWDLESFNSGVVSWGWVPNSIFQRIHVWSVYLPTFTIYWSQT